MERPGVVVEAQQQRPDVGSRPVLVPPKPGHHTVRRALVLDLEHRPLAGLVGRIEPLRDDSVESGALETLEPIGRGRPVAGRRRQVDGRLGVAEDGLEARASLALRDRPQVLVAECEQVLAKAQPPVHLTPATTDRAMGEDWFGRFEGAGLDGVIAKRLDASYQPGKRAMLKIKHQRTADCVVAGFRWHKNGPGTHVGSLLLGLFDDGGMLHHLGITSSFTWDKREALAKELEPLRENATDGHPWADLAEWASMGATDASGQRLPGATSRWNRGKDLSWVALRPERVVEVAYDHLQGDRFRHATTFKRWRPDKRPADCRYDQLEETAPYLIGQIFGTD